MAAAMFCIAPASAADIVVSDGHRFQVSKPGSASGPVIVLQAGLGDDLDVWRSLGREFNRQSRVFAYSRPGYGRSAAAEGARDPCTIARELHRLLESQQLAPPYVLVGHSIGGLYQWVFAALYPDDVSGLILLDPTHPDHWTVLQRDAKGSAGMVRVMKALFTGPMRAEFDDQQRCLDSLDRAAARAVPAAILVRTRYSMAERGAFQTAVERLQQDWLSLITAGKGIERIERSGHYLQKDRPDAVLAAIQAMVARQGE